MRWTHIRHLLDIEAILSLRRMNRKKTKTHPKHALRQLAGMSVLFILFILIFYGTFYLLMPLHELPGLSTYAISMFLAIGFLQFLMMTYSAFFSENSSQRYITLPYTLHEIFLSKVLLIFFTVGVYFVPIHLLLFLVGYKAGIGFLLSLLYSLGLAIILVVTILLMALLVLSLIQVIPYFRKHSKLVASILFGIGSISSAIIILGMNYFINDNENSGAIADYTPLPYLDHFHSFMVQPTFDKLGMLGLYFILSLVGNNIYLVNGYCLNLDMLAR